MIKQSLGYYLNERRGLSTRPGTLQTIEKNVIILRYGIYDKIDYSFLPQVFEYNLSNTLQFGQWKSIKKVIPNYDKFMAARKKMWLELGIKNHYLKTKKINGYIYKTNKFARQQTKRFLNLLD